ncbi:MAG: nucleotidyltransferase domain-containing protein [Candidatus Odinarchaeota archaeon]|nr:nucleotidyltransferase domain-containing protein [Candidatus Odinarchaeota archaeon]
MYKENMDSKGTLTKQEILTTVKDLFEPLDYIIFAYLFGSYATGKVWAMSDIDIAVYVDPRKVNDLFKLKLRLLGMLNDAFKTDKIDLVILNEAPPVLKYEILVKGILIFTKDKEIHTEFYLRATKEYFDFQYILDKNYEAVKEALRRKRN